MVRFVTGLAAGAGLGYLISRRLRHDRSGRDSSARDTSAWGPPPPRGEEPGRHGGIRPPEGDGQGPVVGPAVRPASLQGAPAGDALVLLAREHDELRESVAALMLLEPGGAHEKGDLRAAVQRVISDATRHEAAEEEHFWPFVRTRVRGGEGLAATGKAHELEAKRLLQALDSRQPGDIDWAELLTGLRDLMGEHIGFEEGHVWPQLDAVMTPVERTDMGARLARAEELAPTRPHPSELADPAKHPKLSRAVALVDRGVDRVAARGRGPHG